MATERPILVVANVIYDSITDSFLLGKSLEGRKKGCYIFPGGKVENETLESAFWRELKEETGLVKSKVLGGKLHYCGYTEEEAENGKRYLVMYFLTEYTSDMGRPTNIESDKHDKWEFIDRIELDNFPIWKTNKNILPSINTLVKFIWR